MRDQQRQRVPVSSLHNHPDLTPKQDDHLVALMEGAVRGEVPVYFAAVPLSLCIPFGPDYRPELHRVGAEAIDQTIEAWQKGKFAKLVVYQRGVWFVVADDYIPLFAALRGRPDYVPCWVLGKPAGGLVKDVQGPIAPADVPELFGLA